MLFPQKNQGGGRGGGNGCKTPNNNKPVLRQEFNINITYHIKPKGSMQKIKRISLQKQGTQTNLYQNKGF